MKNLIFGILLASFCSCGNSEKSHEDLGSVDTVALEIINGIGSADQSFFEDYFITKEELEKKVLEEGSSIKDEKILDEIVKMASSHIINPEDWASKMIDVYTEFSNEHSINWGNLKVINSSFEKNKMDGYEVIEHNYTLKGNKKVRIELMSILIEGNYYLFKLGWPFIV